MMLNFMKIRPVGAELFYADRQRGRQTDGQTDMTQLLVAFGNFTHGLKKLYAIT
jgi:hypothetical protein